MSEKERCGYEGTTTGHPCRFPVSRSDCPKHGDRETDLGGRPRQELPADAAGEIEKLAGYGLTRDEIADFFGLGSESTLRRRIKESEELLAAYARGRAEYRRSTHKRIRDIAFNRRADLELAEDESVSVSEQRKALVWIEKSQFGAAEKHEFEHSGSLPTPTLITVEE